MEALEVTTTQQVKHQHPGWGAVLDRRVQFRSSRLGVHADTLKSNAAERAGYNAQRELCLSLDLRLGTSSSYLAEHLLLYFGRNRDAKPGWPRMGTKSRFAVTNDGDI